MDTPIDIGPSDEPMTVEEVRAGVRTLIEGFKDHQDVSLLALVHTMLDSIECTCQPPTIPTAPAKMFDLDAKRKNATN